MYAKTSVLKNPLFSLESLGSCFRQYVLQSRNQHSCNVIKHQSYEHVANLLDISLNEALSLTKKCQALTDIHIAEVRETLSILDKLGFSKSDICSTPKILCIPFKELKNRILLFEEFGLCFSLKCLVDFSPLYTKKILVLHKYGYLVDRRSIEENIFGNHLKVKRLNGEHCDENHLTLKQLYNKIYIKYMQHFLCKDYPDRRMVTPWISFRLLHQNLYILKNIYELDAKVIRSNMFVLHTDPSNLMNISASMNGLDRKKIMRRCPKLARISDKKVEQVREFLKSSGISDIYVQNVPSVFQLDEETVRYRIHKNVNSPVLSFFANQPRFLKLIVNQEKVNERLKIIERLKLNPFSFGMYSCTDKEFLRCVTEGVVKIRLSDSTIYIASKLLRNETDVKNELKKHPYAHLVPIENVKKTLNSLLDMQFTEDQIFKSIQLVLYPPEKVDKVLAKLHTYPGVECCVSNKSQFIDKNVVLPLVLYFIEKESNFSGAGIWDDKNTSSSQHLYSEEHEEEPVAVEFFCITL